MPNCGTSPCSSHAAPSQLKENHVRQTERKKKKRTPPNGELCLRSRELTFISATTPQSPPSRRCTQLTDVHVMMILENGAVNLKTKTNIRRGSVGEHVQAFSRALTCSHSVWLICLHRTATLYLCRIDESMQRK